MNDKRTLAVVMFTDIVGYTALIGDRTDEARVLLETNRTLQRPLIGEHQGLLLKEIDDGLLASFSNASQALKCALSIHDAAQKSPNLQLRIGIHLGEVVFSQGDVVGEGIVIASRLEPMSLPGGITVSESIYEQTKEKFDLSWEDLGEKRLRDVQERVRIYRYHPELAVPVKPTRRILGLGRLPFFAIVGTLMILILLFLFFGV